MRHLSGYSEDDHGRVQFGDFQQREQRGETADRNHHSGGDTHPHRWAARDERRSSLRNGGTQQRGGMGILDHFGIEIMYIRI